jgi:hypothetical protein
MMKKILFCLMALLCVMGVSAQTANRSVAAVIPQEYQIPVNVTIDDEPFNLIPQKAAVYEVDSSHVQLVVYHNRGNAKVTVPVTYDWVLDATDVVLGFAYKTNIITQQQHEFWLRVYTSQRSK